MNPNIEKSFKLPWKQLFRILSRNNNFLQPTLLMSASVQAGRNFSLLLCSSSKPLHLWFDYPPNILGLVSWSSLKLMNEYIHFLWIQHNGGETDWEDFRQFWHFSGSCLECSLQELLLTSPTTERLLHVCLLKEFLIWELSFLVSEII